MAEVQRLADNARRGYGSCNEFGEIVMKACLAALLVMAAAPLQAQASAAPVGSSTQTPSVIDPQQLELAETAVESIFPPGSYGRMMAELMGGSMDAMMGGVLDMTAADLGVPSDAKGKVPEGTLREKIVRQDPHFEERMRIMTRVMGEEMGRIGAKIEPAMRAGLARAIGRRFTAAQLVDINRFLATDSGKAFGSQMLLVWVDPEMMTAMLKSVPAMMKDIPSIMKKVEAATAHLPKPKKEADADGADDGGDAGKPQPPKG